MELLMAWIDLDKQLPELGELSVKTMTIGSPLLLDAKNQVVETRMAQAIHLAFWIAPSLRKWTPQ